MGGTVLLIGFELGYDRTVGFAHRDNGIVAKHLRLLEFLDMADRDTITAMHPDETIGRQHIHKVG
ncbi:hypothetical protein D3C87_2002310 [compost metagenome]